MFRRSRFAVFILCAFILAMAAPVGADSQARGGRHSPPPPAPPRHAVVVRGQVFIGGYFYDPFFGPYPWWHRTAYPYRYFPVYDSRAEVRVQVTPREAAIYVDGFYAGIVDDFDGIFQGLPLPPGGHEFVLYLEGYRTTRYDLYLRPGSTLKLHDTMERPPVGASSEPPPVAAPVPPPPPGSFRPPRTPPRIPIPPPSQSPTVAPQAPGFATLDLRVQPISAQLTIDGQRWLSSDEGHIVVQVPEGAHRVEVVREGYRRFTTDIEVREGETKPLNVSLMSAAP
jgi:hypothetical protein